MNKKGQDDALKWMGGIFSAFMGIILLVAVAGIVSNLGCEDENAQITSLTNDINLCNSKLQDQTELTQSLNAQCENKVINATKECEDDLSINLNIVNSYRVMFVIHYISFGLALVFGLNLFKGFLNFEIKVKNRKISMVFKGVKVVWIGMKWFIFVMSILIFLFATTSLIFPHWFFN